LEREANEIFRLQYSTRFASADECNSWSIAM